MTTHDIRTGSETAIPADVMEAMEAACTIELVPHGEVRTRRAIARAIMAERERCAPPPQTKTNVDAMRDALSALLVQALQSELNTPSHEWGWEAIGKARDALGGVRAVPVPQDHFEEAEPVAWQPKYKPEFVAYMKRIRGNALEPAVFFPTKKEAEDYGSGGHDARPLYDRPAMLLQPSVTDEVAAERIRQIEVEGFDAQHDDRYPPDTLAMAGAAYALPEKERRVRLDNGFQVWRMLWPWDAEWFKPNERRRDLVKAAALIVAEIERLDRLSTPH